MAIVRRTILKIDAEDLALAVIEVLDDPTSYTRGHWIFAAAVVEAAKRRASLEVEFGAKGEA